MEHFIGDGVLFTSLYKVCGTIIGIATLYWLFYMPCNWKKNIDEVGYNIILRDKKHLNAVSKKDAINRIRKLRKIGVKELPPPYPNGWYSIMESSDLRQGEAKSVSALGEQFAIFRTLDNTVYVLDAYCPHMGANLGVGGRVVGGSIECPFHQWSFRGSDGKCVNVPYSTCAPQTSKVKKWISCEINDNIFVWYHSESDQEPWPLPVVKEIESKEFVYHGRNEFYVNCHIQEIPENGADLAHFRAIHKASVLAGGTDPLNSALKSAGYHHWDALWKPSEAPSKHIARVTLKHSIEITKKIHAFEMDVVGEQIGPSYVQLHMKSPSMGRIEVLQTVTPIEPMLQKVVHRFYAPRILGPFMKFVVLGESIMFERDMSMWNHKIFRKQPQLVKEEMSVKLFRNWYSQFYSENSRLFSEAYENIDW
ncbi:cholesterol 7-desaturase nvd [Calliphora vicina]|uniref:cholesterol 7-desaturase nvd n=1 Tax=Calliphora vicina TaxID=7373 RepID=UPI00325A6C02